MAALRAAGQLARWLDERAHARVHPADPERRSVRELLELERTRLLPMGAGFQRTLTGPAR